MAVTRQDRLRGRAVVIRPRFAWEAVAWAVVVLVALIVLERSRHVLALVLVALTVAALLRGPIVALDRRLPRWAAITTAVLGSVGAVVALLVLGTIQLREQIDAVKAAVTDRIGAVDPDSAFGEFLAEAQVTERVAERLDQLPSQVLIGSSTALEGARLATEALLMIVLAVYALVNGPRLLRPLTGDDAPWWSAAVREGVAAGAAQVRRLVGIAVVSGLLGWIVAMVFDLPGEGVLGIWVGVWSVVPIFGPVVGYAPLIVVASLDGSARAVAVAAVAALAAVAGWYADRRISTHVSGSVPRLGPFGIAVALVVGLQFGWMTGPLVAVLVISSVVCVVSALAASSRRRNADDDDGDGVSTSAHVWARLAVRPSARAASIVVVAVAAIAFVVDISPVPVWVTVGVTLAIALDPLVTWIDARTPLGRGGGASIVIVGLLAVVTTMLVVAVPSVADSVRDLDDELPAIAADFERLPLIGDELAERGVAEQIQVSLEELPDRLASERGPIEGMLRSIGDGLLATFWILLIAVTGLVDGGRVRDGMRSLFPPERRSQVDQADTTVRRVIARYAVGSVVVAAIAGAAVFVIALSAGIPLAPLLGLWAFMTNFIPQVGGYLGGAPLVVMALTLGVTKGLIVAAFYVVYLQVENRIIQPVIVSKAVDIAPFVAMVAVLIGGATAGVVGAVLVTPLVAVVKSLHTELRRSPSDTSV